MSNTDNSPFKYISFVAIHVSDIALSRKFYRDGLGFTEVSHLLVKGKSPSAVELGLEELTTEGFFLERDGMRIQLQHQNRPEHAALPEIRQQMGLSHFGVRVDNMDAALERVLEFGGTVPVGRRHKNEQYNSEVARIRDPDGLRIEILQMPGDYAQLPGNPIN